MKKYSSKFHEWEFTSYYITTVEDAEKAVTHLTADVLHGLDIETAKNPDYKDHALAGLCPLLSKIRLLQIYSPKTNAVYIYDMFSVPWGVLQDVLKSRRFASHNGIFEISHLTHQGYKDLNIGCSMLLSQLIDGAERSIAEPEMPITDILDEETNDDKDGLSRYRFMGHNLDACIQREFGVKVEKIQQTSDWGKEVLDDEQITYAGLDALLTYKLANKLSGKIKEYKMEKSYTLLKQMQHVVAHMQLTGMPVDWEYHAKLMAEWKVKLEESLKACKPFYGDINIHSGKQMNEWVVNYFKNEPLLLASWPKSDKGAYSFSKIAITQYKHIPAIAPLLEYKKYAKLLDTYGESLIEKKHPVTGRLHTSYTLGETRTGRLSSRKPNCYSKDTEILTQRGWVQFNTLTKLDKVASWYPDGSIKFILPTKHHRYKYNGKLVYLKNDHTDLLVTPDHRCLTLRRRTNKLLVLEAQYYQDDLLQVHAGNLVGTTKKVKKELLQLLIATQADAHITQWGKLHFVFSKKRKAIRLTKILKSLAISFVYSRGKKGQYRFIVQRCIAIKWVVEQLGKSKKLPFWFLKLTPECLSIATKEFRYWDGLITRKSDAYCSVVKHNADIVQACFSLTNRRAIITPYNAHRKINKHRKIAYNVLSPLTNCSYTTNLKIRKRKYNDYVYCVTVPSGFVLVRRNGRAIISGNCQNFPRDKWFRNMFAVEGDHVLVVSDFSQIELRLQAEFSKDPVMQEVYRKGEDIYCSMASTIYSKKITKENKIERFIGKTVMLALGYGMGSKKLGLYALNAGIVQPPEFWDLAWKTYHNKFKVYSLWCDKVRERARRLKYIETYMGKRRKLVESELYTRAPNTVIQGSASELMMLAMLNCYKAIQGIGHIVATVHDEILLCVKKEHAETATKLLSKAMNDAMIMMFPDAACLEVAEAAYGERWGDVKGEL